MDLLTLTAKLTLDKSAYDTALSAAEKAAKEFSGPSQSKLTLDTTGFMIGARGAEDAAGDVGEAINEVKEIYKFGDIAGGIWDGIKDKVTTSGVIATITSVTNALAKCVGMAGQYGDSVDKGAARLGISTQAYQEWSYALSMSGANVANLTSGVKKLNSWLNGTDGEGLEETGEDAEKAAESANKVAEAMEQLGISAKDGNGNLKSTEQILEDTVMALAGMEEGSERNNLAATIFGSSGALNALLNSGTSGIEGLREEAENLGLVMSEDAVKNAAAYEDAIGRLQTEIDAVKQSFGEGLLPVLTDAVDKVSEIVKFFNLRTLGKNNGLDAQFKAIDQDATETAGSINGTEAASMTLLDKLLEMGDATHLTAEQFSIWQSIAEKLIDNIPTLSGHIDTETGKIKGNTEELKNNIKAWAERQRQQAAAQVLADKQAALAKKTAEYVEAQAEAEMAEADISAERAKAVEDVNKVLEKYGSEQRVNEDGSNLSEVVEQQQASWSNNWRKNKGALEELGNAYDSVSDKIKEADDKQAIADSLKAEVEKGQEELAKLSTAIDNVLDIDTSEAKKDIFGVKSWLDSLPDKVTITIEALMNQLDTDGSFASGSNYIPYDMTANLHRGEAVLSASQARDYRSGSGVDTSSLKADIVSAISAGLNNATLNVNSYINGKKVTDEVSKDMSNRLKAKRYAP